MRKIEIDQYRTVISAYTGIGWVAVEKWNPEKGEYEHVSTHRTKAEAETIIQRLSKEE